MIASRLLVRLAVAPLLVGLIASCSAADFGGVPSTQRWIIFYENEPFAQVIIDNELRPAVEAPGSALNLVVAR